MEASNKSSFLSVKLSYYNMMLDNLSYVSNEVLLFSILAKGSLLRQFFLSKVDSEMSIRE